MYNMRLDRRSDLERNENIAGRLTMVEEQLAEINKTLFDLNTALIFKTPESFTSRRFDYLINALRLARQALQIQKESIENIRMLYLGLNGSDN